MSVTLSKAGLEQLWVRAGGRPSAAGMAAAIALAESSGNPQSTDHDSNGTVDRGLWQINSIHGSLSTYDELANARAAVQISNNGADWTPWVTYQTGAYARYLTGTYPGSNIPATTTKGSPTPGGASTSSSTGAYGGLGGWLLKATLTITFVGAGLLLTGIGARNTLGGSR